MKRKHEKEIEVIVKSEPDLTQVPKGIMDAFIDLLAEEIFKFRKRNYIRDSKQFTDGISLRIYERLHRG